jgi:hypothetical protein
MERHLGGMTMKFGTSANPEQVEAMAHVVAAHCKHIGVEPGTPEEEHIATLVVALHEVGVRGESELLRALIAPDNRLPTPTIKANIAA